MELMEEDHWGGEGPFRTGRPRKNKYYYIYGKFPLNWNGFRGFFWQWTDKYSPRLQVKLQMNLPSLPSPLYIYFQEPGHLNLSHSKHVVMTADVWHTTMVQRRSCRRHHPRRCCRGRRTAHPIWGSVILPRPWKHPRSSNRCNQTASSDRANNRTRCILLGGRKSHRRRSSSHASLPRHCTDEVC
jgi:hypothetical protein